MMLIHKNTLFFKYFMSISNFVHLHYTIFLLIKYFQSAKLLVRIL